MFCSVARRRSCPVKFFLLRTDIDRTWRCYLGALIAACTNLDTLDCSSPCHSYRTSSCLSSWCWRNNSSRLQGCSRMTQIRSQCMNQADRSRLEASSECSTWHSMSFCTHRNHTFALLFSRVVLRFLRTAEQTCCIGRPVDMCRILGGQDRGSSISLRYDLRMQCQSCLWSWPDTFNSSLIN